MRTPYRSKRKSKNRNNVVNKNLWINDSDSMFLPQQLQPLPHHSQQSQEGSAAGAQPQLAQAPRPPQPGPAESASVVQTVQTPKGGTASADIGMNTETPTISNLTAAAAVAPAPARDPATSAIGGVPGMRYHHERDYEQNLRNISTDTNGNGNGNGNYYYNQNRGRFESDMSEDDGNEMRSLLASRSRANTNDQDATPSLSRGASTSSTASTQIFDNSGNDLEHGGNPAAILHRHRKRDRQRQRRRRRRRTRSEDQGEHDSASHVEMEGSGGGGHNQQKGNKDWLHLWRYCCFFCFCCFKNLFPHSKIAKSGRSLCGRCCDRTMVRSTLSVMSVLAKMVLWCSVLALCVGVVWYSYELKNNGTDTHLVAWFSAGAFVILGFPISMYGIISHLANYNQPTVQCYVVRILWMVPIYSIESWLCLRFHRYAIYIETLRDCYESYVLYSFLQFLIQVLGGEEALILMLKDKSPTRGVHMWGLQWCVKPWLMGQPVRKTYQPSNSRLNSGLGGSNHENGNVSDIADNDAVHAAAVAISPSSAASSINSKWKKSDVDLVIPSSNTTTASQSSISQGSSRAFKRVHWKSPFFVYCKFGVLQYVLLKFVCSIVVMILERNGIYKEGDFTPKGGYLYICILTNLSQCWALYCLIFFYYATKTELGPIRPVGKFLSVKALVFFTWWQSVCISMLYQMDLIPHYRSSSSSIFSSSGMGEDDGSSTTVLTPADYDVTSGTISEHAALALDKHGGMAIGHGPTEWTSEDVAKGLQDYLICIEMFIAAIVHTFVFPHLDYSVEAVEARTRALNQTPHKHWNKRLGRKWKDWDNKSGYSLGTLSNYSEPHHQQQQQQQHHLRQYNQQHVLPLLSSPERRAGQGHEEELEMSNRYRCDSIGEDNYLMEHPMDRLHDSQAKGNSSSNANILPTTDGSAANDLESDFSGAEEFVSLASSTNHAFDDVGYEDDDDAYSDGSSDSRDGDDDDDADDIPLMPSTQKPNFVRALLDSTIPQDLRDNTVGIIKGDYIVERKTLLHHAATSDSYDLFSRVNTPRRPSKKEAED